MLVHVCWKLTCLRACWSATHVSAGALWAGPKRLAAGPRPPERAAPGAAAPSLPIGAPGVWIEATCTLAVRGPSLPGAAGMGTDLAGRCMGSRAGTRGGSGGLLLRRGFVPAAIREEGPDGRASGSCSAAQQTSLFEQLAARLPTRCKSMHPHAFSWLAPLCRATSTWG